MNDLLKSEYKSIGKVAGYLWEKGWAEKNAGNISVNVTDLFSHEDVGSFYKSGFYELEEPFPALADRVIMITASGSRMRDVKKKPTKQICLTELDENGTKYRILSTAGAPKDIRPTSEMPAHLAIHDYLIREKRSQRTVLHAHVTEAIMLTHFPGLTDEKQINEILWSIQPETSLFIPEGIGFVPFRLPGSYDIAKDTIAKLNRHKAILWEKHGCLVVNKNLEEAFDIMEIISKTFDIYIKCRMAGFEPEGLSEEQIRHIRESLS